MLKSVLSDGVLWKKIDQRRNKVGRDSHYTEKRQDYKGCAFKKTLKIALKRTTKSLLRFYFLIVTLMRTSIQNPDDEEGLVSNITWLFHQCLRPGCFLGRQISSFLAAGRLVHLSLIHSV